MFSESMFESVSYFGEDLLPSGSEKHYNLVDVNHLTQEIQMSH